MARKRVNGEGSLRKRKNGTWEGRISVGVNLETGKILTKSVYGRTKKEVHDKMAALLSGDGQQAASPTAISGITSEPEPQTDEMTVSEWLDTWLAEYLVDVKRGTYNAYESVVRLHLKPVIGKYRLSELKTPIIQKVLNQYRVDGKSPKYA